VANDAGGLDLSPQITTNHGMPERSRTRRKRPRDPNELAKFVLDIATGEREDVRSTRADDNKNPAAVALGRLGGLKGGRSRSEKMSPEERSRIARLAAQSRWGKRNGNN
jgi:hypothetical protein